MNVICSSKYFWRSKLERDYPFLVKFTDTEDPKHVYVKYFTWVSEKIERVTDQFVEEVYGTIIKIDSKPIYDYYMKMYNFIRTNEDDDVYFSEKYNMHMEKIDHDLHIINLISLDKRV